MNPRLAGSRMQWAATGMMLVAGGVGTALTAGPDALPAPSPPDCRPSRVASGGECPLGAVDDSMPAIPSASRVGVASCSASSCHGGPKGTDHAVTSFAATIWMERDPHARAYEVLHSQRSRRMADLLGIGPPHLSRRCLVCHSMADISESPLPDEVLADGVGCASCHGDPSAWGTEHTLASWARTSRDRRAALGYRDLSTPLDRARTCTRCHVGDATHEVDHALVAAGHPRLMFEFAAYQRRSPRHWSPAGRAEAADDFSARSWAVGQAVTLEATARLLEARVAVAPSPMPGAPSGDRWPEFAEFDCQGCHRTVAGTVSAVADAPRSRWSAVGTPAWQPWSQAGATLMAGDASAAAVAADLGDLRRLLEERWAPADPTRRGRVRLAARGLAVAAARGAEELSTLEVVDLGPVAGRIDELVADGGPGFGSWEAAVQSVLAIEAILDGGPARRGAAVRDGDEADGLGALRASLRFPPGRDSPPPLHPSVFERLRSTVR